MSIYGNERSEFHFMKQIRLGLIAGFIFGVIDILLMVPLSFPDKTAAMTGAFINRFAIGFLIPTTQLNLPYWLQGILLGFLLSLPDAIITQAYAPILGIGVVGGLIVGLVTQKLTKK